MIHLHGLRPGKDIETTFTGMRPGEKLYEELALDFEIASETARPKVRQIDGMASHLPLEDVPRRIVDLIHLAEEDDSELAASIQQLIADTDGESSVLDGDADISPISLVYTVATIATQKVVTISSMVQDSILGKVPTSSGGSS